MFLFYREQNNFMCDIFKPVHSITEVLTTMGLCVQKNFDYYNIDYNIIDYYNIDYNIIVCALLFLLLITVLKNSNK